MSIAVRAMEDVAVARQEIKRFAAVLPFKPEDLGRIEIAVSELASNMIKHAEGGKFHVSRLPRRQGWALTIAAVDRGPGIANLPEAMTPGFSTAGSFGDGLHAVRELMDRFEIATQPGHGTRVEVEKWVD